MRKKIADGASLLLFKGKRYLKEHSKDGVEQIARSVLMKIVDKVQEDAKIKNQTCSYTADKYIYRGSDYNYKEGQKLLEAQLLTVLIHLINYDTYSALKDTQREAIKDSIADKLFTEGRSYQTTSYDIVKRRYINLFEIDKTALPENFTPEQSYDIAFTSGDTYDTEYTVRSGFQFNKCEHNIMSVSFPSDVFLDEDLLKDLIKDAITSNSFAQSLLRPSIFKIDKPTVKVKNDRKSEYKTTPPGSPILVGTTDSFSSEQKKESKTTSIPSTPPGTQQVVAYTSLSSLPKRDEPLKSIPLTPRKP